MEESLSSGLYVILKVYRGLVKWYDRSLQNFWWEFDSLIPCYKPLYFSGFFMFIDLKKKIRWMIILQYVWKYNSPIGEILMSADREGLTGLWFKNQKYFASKLKGEYSEKNLKIFEKTAEWLDIYFNGENPGFTPYLHLNGTPFQMTVWEILRQIPYGNTVTYKEIACQIVRQRGITQMSAQAVGGAVGRNPISIIIPCHRVVGSDGNLTGYAGGIDKKSYLLSLEKTKKD